MITIPNSNNNNNNNHDNIAQQAWGYEDIEARVPGHVELWFRYYLDFLGVDVVIRLYYIV